MLFAAVVGPEKFPGCDAHGLCGCEAFKGLGQTPSLLLALYFEKSPFV